MSEEYPECFRRVLRKARKPHRCCECRGVIQRGEVYTYMSGIWDYPQSFKTCPECIQIGFEADLRNKSLRTYETRYIGGLLEFIDDDEDLLKKFNENATRRKITTAPA